MQHNLGIGIVYFIASKQLFEKWLSVYCFVHYCTFHSTGCKINLSGYRSMPVLPCTAPCHDYLHRRTSPIPQCTNPPISHNGTTLSAESTRTEHDSEIWWYLVVCFYSLRVRLLIPFSFFWSTQSIDCAYVSSRGQPHQARIAQKGWESNRRRLFVVD